SEDLAVAELALAEARHAARGVLEAEHEAPLEASLPSLELFGRDPFGQDRIDLLADEPEHLFGALGPGRRVDGQQPRLGERRVAGVDRINEAPLLADL